MARIRSTDYPQIRYLWQFTGCYSLSSPIMSAGLGFWLGLGFPRDMYHCQIALHICPSFHSLGFKSMFAIMVLYYLKQLANKTFKSKSFTAKSKGQQSKFALKHCRTRNFGCP